MLFSQIIKTTQRTKYIYFITEHWSFTCYLRFEYYIKFLLLSSIKVFHVFFIYSGDHKCCMSFL